MLVKNWMSKPVITVDINDSMQKVISAFRENNINMIPVLDRGNLVGVITERDVLKEGQLIGVITESDLKKATTSGKTSINVNELIYLAATRIKLEGLVTRDPITVAEDLTVEETAEILLAKKISGVPVVNAQGALVGVITQHDLFRSLISLTGLRKRGIQLALRLKDKPGAIKEITDIIRNYGCRMSSILSSYERAPSGFRNVYIRFFQIDRKKLPLLQKEIEEKTKILYIVDHRENKRELYSV
ncbi:CBS domain protein [uncultured Desulfobacterium sp.]|uniref:CBS domain protein n=1 Tax=uncultured Desulfobacterium sp. TaxID=201089 RepID=A0A445MSG8_9BACT|nr:CBS domain protein [uncultured Desulfobacterium sp.]